MKTITINSATKKLANTNSNKSSMAYKNVKKVLQGNKQIRPVYTSGSGRFCSNQDHTKATTDILDSMGIEYIITNDSKRGGLTGTLITIKTKIK